MRSTLMAPVALGFLVAWSQPGLTQDTPRALVDKAIKAYGGPDKLAKLKAVTVKSKGTIEIMGTKLPFTKESWADLSGKFKEVMDLEVGGKKTAVKTVYNGKKAKIQADGKDIPLPDAVLKEFEEAIYMMKLAQLLSLQSKTIELSLLGEEQVNGKPALGVKIKSSGHRDVNVYFDKDTSLTVKVAFRAVDLQTQQEVTEERIVSEFQEVDGLKCGKKINILRDGKPVMDAEVTDMKFVDGFDANEFE
jgi:hypothetical protein